MKTIKVIASLCLGIVTLAACSGSDDVEKDLEKPTISGAGIVASPIDCQQYKRGEVLPVNYMFGDNRELGEYTLEVHNNFDHHNHDKHNVACEKDEDKEPVKPWIYKKEFKIPSGNKTYTARHDISIPNDIDPGDYHFMIYLTDAAGHMQTLPVSIKIIK